MRVRLLMTSMVKMMKIRHLLAVCMCVLWATCAFAQPQTVKLEWDAVVSPDLVGYNLYWATSANGPWTRKNSGAIVPNSYDAVFSEDIESDLYFCVTAFATFLPE